MKRRRPTPWRLACLKAGLWGREAIAPGTVVKLKDSKDWLVGRQFRIGYYSRMDGLNCVWLVNDEGFYEQTVDQRMILKEFEVITRSSEADLYGDNRPKLEPLKRPA